jgi:release factor glutamine methyltransferase
VLEHGGVVYAEQEAAWLVEAASGLGRVELALRCDPFDDEVVRRTLELAERRASGEPLQYITGSAAFRHLDLTVGPGVFIPRPETELVVDRALELLPPHGTAVDVGTGSGAIALSIAVERPDSSVFATESSAQALGYAMRNAASCDAAVEFFVCDLMTGLPEHLRAAVDLCVSNPPYVPVGARSALPRDVVRHEPHLALFGGDDGLEAIRRLVREARRWLRRGGWLVLEIGDRQGDAVAELMRRAGYDEVSWRPDLAGRERVVEARA